MPQQMEEDSQGAGKIDPNSGSRDRLRVRHNILMTDAPLN